MSQMPLYRVNEDIFAALERELAHDQLQLLCAQPMHLQNDGVTMYRGWEIKRANVVEVIMWDQHRVDRMNDDPAVELTLGTPKGRAGLDSLSAVERALNALGGHKLV